MDYPLFLSISDYGNTGPTGYTGPYPPPPERGIFYANVTNVSNKDFNNATYLKESSSARVPFVNSLLQPGESTTTGFYVDPGSKLNPNDIVAFLIEPVRSSGEFRVVSNTVTFVDRYRDL